VLKGDSPSPTGPASEIVSFFSDGRSGILAGAYVQMVALGVLAVVLVTVRRLVVVRESVAGDLVVVAIALTLAAYTIYIFLTAALAFGAGTDARPETAKALWEIRFVSEVFIAFPAALLAAGVAVAWTKRRWIAWFSVAAAGALALGGAGFARNGFFAPDGGYGFLLFWLLPIWVLVTAFGATSRPQRGHGDAVQPVDVSSR
jgi:hypothetical protein